MRLYRNCTHSTKMEDCIKGKQDYLCFVIPQHRHSFINNAMEGVSRKLHFKRLQGPGDSSSTKIDNLKHENRVQFSKNIIIYRIVL